MSKKPIKTIGELKKQIKDLPNDLPIEVEVHNADGVYVIENIYRCGNGVREPIISFYVRCDWDLTERDEKAFKEYCKENDC